MTDDASPAQAQPDRVAETVRALEKELRTRSLRLWLQRFGVVVALGLLVGAYYYFRVVRKPPPPPAFSYKPLERRDVFEEVQSTGTVKPVTEVEVGAQVSGRIVKVHVDFNSTVKKGDLLAEIDPSLFGAQVSQAGAQLEAAKAAVKRAKAQVSTTQLALERAKRLMEDGLTSKAELDQAQGSHDIAKADLAASQAQITQLNAQLVSARTTLAYARIYSPIDGVVIDRAVDPGQTVAASFSAPVLFVIAQDLSKMQVLADIDEADVGKLKEGMNANVVVDAFPGETFEGKLAQLRFSPNDVQGVVTYSAVIDVRNPETKLRPGMTATVTIRTREVKNVLAVPNAALRFKPLPIKANDQSSEPPSPQLVPLKHGEGRVYLPNGEDAVKPWVVRVGITDGVWTELRTRELAEGAEVVTSQREPEKKRGLFGR